MPNILINRLYLNLKSFESPNSTTATEAISRPMFASRRILGNIGAPLHTILDEVFDSETDHNFEGEREVEEVLRDVGDGDEEWRGTAGRCGNTTLVPVVSGIVSIHLTYLTYIVHLRTPIACSHH